MKKRFYGWYIVIAAILMTAVTSGVMSTLSVFLSPMRKSFGSSQAQISLIFTFLVVGMMLGSIIFGKAANKANLKILMPIAGVVEGVGIISMGLFSNLITYYVIAVILGIAVAAGSSLTAPILIRNWFISKRGLALGLQVAGIGLGSAVFAPICNLVIAKTNFRTALICFGIFIILISMIAFALLRTRPEDMGLLPYGKNEGDPAEKETMAAAELSRTTGFTLKQSLTKASFWFVVLFGMTYGFVATNIVAQTPSYLAKLNWSPSTISLFLMGFGICSIIGKITLGHILDKQGLQTGGYIAVAITVVAMASMVMLPVFPAISIFYVLFAAPGTMMSTIAMPMYVSKLFGDKYFSSVFATITVISSITTMVSSVVSGAIADAMGFSAIYIVNIIIILLSAVCFTAALKTNQLGKEVPNKLN